MDFLLDGANLLFERGGSYGISWGVGQLRILGETEVRPLIHTCLVGANGCGKTTFLRRLHKGALQGFPEYVTTFLVEQDVSYCTKDTKIMSFRFSVSVTLTCSSLTKRLLPSNLWSQWTWREQNSSMKWKIFLRTRLAEVSYWDTCVIVHFWIVLSSIETLNHHDVIAIVAWWYSKIVQ